MRTPSTLASETLPSSTPRDGESSPLKPRNNVSAQPGHANPTPEALENEVEGLRGEESNILLETSSFFQAVSSPLSGDFHAGCVTPTPAQPADRAEVKIPAGFSSNIL